MSNSLAPLVRRQREIRGELKRARAHREEVKRRVDWLARKVADKPLNHSAQAELSAMRAAVVLFD